MDECQRFRKGQRFEKVDFFWETHHEEIQRCCYYETALFLLLLLPSAQKSELAFIHNMGGLLWRGAGKKTQIKWHNETFLK
jgi:hypothetical protein